MQQVEYTSRDAECVAYKCPFCDNGVMTRGLKTVTYRCKGGSLDASQSGEYCNSCDQSILTPDDLSSTAGDIERLLVMAGGRVELEE